MRILSALIITYCCGCIVPANLNKEHDGLRTLEDSFSTDITSQIGSKESSFHNYRRRSRRHAANSKLCRKSHCQKISGNQWHRKYVAGSHTRRRNSRGTGSCIDHRTPYDHRKIKNEAGRHACRNGPIKRSETENWKGWEHWGEWSKCSVTCGNGRLVRWRHCTSDKCQTPGLKLAQMKTCHFEDCPQKGMLAWLGIKHHNSS